MSHKRATTVGSHFTHSLRILVDKMLQCNVRAISSGPGLNGFILVRVFC
jgi:hypothetical protein